MNLSKKQQEFKDLALSGKNIYLTGKAGTGKSTIIREVISELKNRGKKVAAIAPTGIAANNIQGQTIHSLFKLPIFGVLEFKECSFVKTDKRKLFDKIDVIVIDEVSMLRPDILDGMHWTLKKNGCAGLETKQIIFVGDLKQLPPVIKSITKSILYQNYKGETFFNAEIYKRLNVTEIELDEILRQSDPDFIDNLNLVRENIKAPYFRKFFKNTIVDDDAIILAPHNDTVKKYNEDGIMKHDGEEFVFEADIIGNLKAEDFNLESTLRLKNGCKIMYLINSHDGLLVNGTLGTYKNVEGIHYITVNGIDYLIEKTKQSKKEYQYDEEKDCLALKEIGSIEQYPVKLAYALSIHKSQGMTFDKIVIDLRRDCFVPGQLYVALSRVRTPEGLTILYNK